MWQHDPQAAQQAAAAGGGPVASSAQQLATTATELETIVGRFDIDVAGLGYVTPFDRRVNTDVHIPRGESSAVLKGIRSTATRREGRLRFALVSLQVAVAFVLGSGNNGLFTIESTHRGRFGRTVLTAAEAGLPALGYVLDYAKLHTALDFDMLAIVFETTFQ